MVRRSLVPFCVVARRIRRKVGVDEQIKQIADLYAMGLPLLDTKRIFSPPLWKLFNSYSQKELAQKVWETASCLYSRNSGPLSVVMVLNLSRKSGWVRSRVSKTFRTDAARLSGSLKTSGSRLRHGQQYRLAFGPAHQI